VGDVSEFEGRVYGIIPAALEQAKAAATNITEEEQTVYEGTIASNTLDIVGIDLTSMGTVNPEDNEYEEIKRMDDEKGIYKKLVLDQGKIVGAIILGDKKGITTMKRLMNRQTDIIKYKDSILEDDFDYKKITGKEG
jgi:nitrite reductase (NADH) large subunit